MTPVTTPRIAAKLAEADSVVVLGLGRFGSALANELVRLGTEVLGVDRDEEIVQAHSATLTQVVQAETTSPDALRQVAVPEFDRAVVGIGSNIEASLLTASVLVDFEIDAVWAKAISGPHAKILERLGVHHVVRPERDMGRRVAHLVRGAMLDFVAFDDRLAMVKTVAPRSAVGRPLRETGLRAEHDVTVVAVQPGGEGEWTYATPDTVLGPDDRIVVSGPPRRAEKFALAR